MSEHTAEVLWRRGEALFVDNRYARAHRWRFDGGAEVAASSSPHSVPLPWSDPAAVDPEEAFVAALASCHMLWGLSIAAQRRFCVDQYQDRASGTLAQNAARQWCISEVTLRPEATFSGSPQPAPAEIDSMHEQSHAQCFLAHSVTARITVEPVIRG